MKLNPEELSTALISFDGLKNTEIVNQLVKGRSIKVQQMYHAFAGSHKLHRGGYILSNKETFDEALKNYKKDTLQTIEYQIDDKKEMVLELNKEVQDISLDEKSAEQKRAISAINATIDDLGQQQIYVINNGIEIYGLKVIGKNKDILELNKLPIVTAIEKVTKDKERWSPILQTRGGN